MVMWRRARKEAGARVVCDDEVCRCRNICSTIRRLPHRNGVSDFRCGDVTIDYSRLFGGRGVPFRTGSAETKSLEVSGERVWSGVVVLEVGGSMRYDGDWHRMDIDVSDGLSVRVCQRYYLLCRRGIFQ